MKRTNTFILVITILICNITNTVKSQNIEFGILGGTNLNFLSLKSDYKLHNSIKSNPLIGFNKGVFFEYKKNQFSFLSSLEYQLVRNKEEPEIILKDFAGQPMGNVETKLIKNKLQLNLIGLYHFRNNFYFGVGISNGLLLRSTLKLDNNIDNGTNNYGNRFINRHYNPIIISMPVIIGYDYNKTGFFIRFYKGITDNIGGKENLIKEVDDTIEIGLKISLIEKDK